MGSWEAAAGGRWHDTSSSVACLARVCVTSSPSITWQPTPNFGGASRGCAWCPLGSPWAACGSTRRASGAAGVRGRGDSIGGGGAGGGLSASGEREGGGVCVGGSHESLRELESIGWPCAGGVGLGVPRPVTSKSAQGQRRRLGVTGAEVVPGDSAVGVEVEARAQLADGRTAGDGGPFPPGRCHVRQEVSQLSLGKVPVVVGVVSFPDAPGCFSLWRRLFG